MSRRSWLPVLAMFGCGDDVPESDDRPIAADVAIHDIAIDAQGRIVGLADGAVVRMDRFGVLDPTFGSDGVARLHVDDPFAPYDVHRADAFVLLDGAIRISVEVPYDDGRFPRIVGLDADGHPDGFAVLNADVPGRQNIQQLLAQGDRLVVNVAEVANDVGELVRYLPDGSRDATFVAPGGMENRALADDRILRITRIPEGDQRRMLVERLSPDGTPDASYGPGVVISNIDVYDSTIDSDRVEVAGRSPVTVIAGGKESVFAVRMFDDRTFDAGFGVGGVAVHTLPGVTITDVANTRDGGALLFGYRRDGATHGVAVRLLANGGIDASFGTDGMLVLANDNTAFHAAAVLPDGTVAAISFDRGPRIALFE